MLALILALALRLTAPIVQTLALLKHWYAETGTDKDTDTDTGTATNTDTDTNTRQGTDTPEAILAYCYYY